MTPTSRTPKAHVHSRQSEMQQNGSRSGHRTADVLEDRWVSTNRQDLPSMWNASKAMDQSHKKRKKETWWSQRLLRWKWRPAGSQQWVSNIRATWQHGGMTITKVDMWTIHLTRLSFTIRATYNTLPSHQNLHLWYGLVAACKLYNHNVDLGPQDDVPLGDHHNLDLARHHALVHFNYVGHFVRTYSSMERRNRGWKGNGMQTY